MSDRVFVGTRKGLFVVSRRSDGWKIDAAHFLGAQVPMVLHDRSRRQTFAALKHGHFGPKMHRSEDQGASWSEVATPAYPPKPDDVPDIIDPMRNVAIPWSLELMWSLESDTEGRLWCGTIPGGLFRSDDRGDSWRLVESLWRVPERNNWFGGGFDFPGIHSVCPDPNHADRLTVGVSCGGVWFSEDAGESWKCRANGMRAAYVPSERAYDSSIQDPHRVVQCAGSPNHFWAQHHNGIFRSTDYCQSWSEIKPIEPSTFGFAVVVHPQDGNTAWFVPAISDEERYPKNGEFVVTRTSDGGETFDVLTKGLPPAPSYHLVFRHCLDIDQTGERLIMGSTTGGLWDSDDGGESWTTITQDLPPVFCLRFA